jgi:hypothetical protein
MTARAAVMAAALALALAAGAHAAGRGKFVALPSPVAPLSPAPPLAGGATSSAERVRHRVDATTTVDVSVDPGGTPFRVGATQRLDVRVTGDYFFTIGAPVLSVEAAPGSASTPGLRAASILWAGFNPGRRTLIARASLDPAAVAPLLPLRVEATPGRVTLVNTTAVTAGAFSANAEVPSLRTYLAQLARDVARGVPPTSGGALVTSRPEPTKARVVAPLLVAGTVGTRRVRVLVADRVTVRADGPIRLTVTPQDPTALLTDPVAGLSGRRLLARVTRASLTLARVRQYRTFLGNPDVTGKSATTYVFRTAARPAPPPAATVHHGDRSTAATLAVAAGLLLALAGAAFAWSRS